MSSKEHRLVALLTQELGRATDAVILGIGDDAAVLQVPRGERLVVSVDAAVEGTHFRLPWLSPLQLGARSFEAALSDLAAMGARPLGAVCGLVLPSAVSARFVQQLARGQAAVAARQGCPVLGGNLARGPEVSLTTTVFGSARRVLTRQGARPGDELWLVGQVGLAALGLRLLQAERRPTSRAARVAIDAWRRPAALLGEGRALLGRASASIDVSDGLVSDALQLARASELRLELEAARLLEGLSPTLMSQGVQPALDLALHGGEDYALLATGPAQRRPAFARRIGRAVQGSGVVLVSPDGRRAPLRSRQYLHFTG